MLKINGKPFISLTALLLLFMFASRAWAQAGPDHLVEIPSSPNPVGSGARAIGMGGAFIAVADDATAASWNPGGIVQLDKPEISFVYKYLRRSENKSFENHPEASSTDSVDYHNLNFFSAAYPSDPGYPGGRTRITHL